MYLIDKSEDKEQNNRIILSGRTETKDTITSLELLDEINFFRKQEGNRTELQHKTLLEIIRDEFEEEIQEQKILLMFYEAEIGNGAKRKQPMYNLTIEQGKQVLVRESKYVRKHVIEKLRTYEITIMEKDRLFAGLFSSDPLVVQSSYMKLIELERSPLIEKIGKQEKDIEYKEDVIMGLVDKVELKDKRAILNQVVKYKGADYQQRWRLLYFEFEKKYHISVKKRLDNYNKKNKKRLNKLDYIELELNRLNELYDIACKLFHSDVQEIIKSYKSIC
ncbi:MAG: hypothetical protein OGM09_10580 [Fusobacterium varium]|uniref:hypothetical protein n=1 Tax=Fusobacterium varium TaxID=856 RepID=UPI00242DF2C8|nr:hypothetical protein [Fusobacterium varium]UYI77615.1 MAG: hypothetical protein OGM09_10580 [Fusobacterium varium]